MISSLASLSSAPILIAALAAALLFHLSRILGPQRLVHAAYAAAAVALIYLLGAVPFGWAFEGQGALFWVYLTLFILAAFQAVRRRARLGAIGLPWISALIQLGVVAYMFAPETVRKPPVTAALFLYFIFEALVWLRGREEQEPAAPAATDARERPPLIPPKRRRGWAEASLATAAVAIAFLLFVGPQAAHVGPEANSPQLEPASEEPAGEPATSEEPAADHAGVDDASRTGSEAREPAETRPDIATSEPATPDAPVSAKEPEAYTARAGDTFKSIAKRFYGSTGKWRAIADLNPEVKSKKLRAGQVIKLPTAPTR